MKDIVSMMPDEIRNEIPGYRSNQIINWLSKGVKSFDEMTNISIQQRESLKENYSIYRPIVLSKQVSKIDGTIKYLWELEDGNAIETVLMKYNYGNTVCISTQVGCKQGCAFCASTIGGIVRNLNPSEMLNEVLCTQMDSGEKISNIVLMGIGEPLDNYDNVIRFLHLANCPELLNIGIRHISISTCGLIERFEDLANEDLQITLAVSLHAPDDETRTKLMPSNRNRGVEAIIDACKKYYSKTGRRISFEYAMINEVNDNLFQAELLAKYSKSVNAHINLIPLNYVSESRFEPSTDERMKAFTDVLDNNHANYTIRRKLGGDVDASCGQLRRKLLKK